MDFGGGLGGEDDVYGGVGRREVRGVFNEGLGDAWGALLLRDQDVAWR